MFKKKRLLKTVAVVIISLIVLVAFLRIAGYKIDKNEQNDPGPKPSDTSQQNFSYRAIEKICSREIEGSWSLENYNYGAWPDDEKYYWVFTPNDFEEMRKYCRDGAVTEYRAVIDILSREDISTVIDKYDSVHASVKALGHKYINDKDYLNRILPDYSSVTIDCIIVFHSPEGTRFFIENGDVHESHDDHKYIEVPPEEFLLSLNNASDEDVTAFWLGLH